MSRSDPKRGPPDLKGRGHPCRVGVGRLCCGFETPKNPAGWKRGARRAAEEKSGEERVKDAKMHMYLPLGF